MDTSLWGLSQPPFLHQLVLLTASSTERRDERQAVHGCASPCLQLQGRQGLALLELGDKTPPPQAQRRGRHPAPPNVCSRISSLVELEKKIGE